MIDVRLKPEVVDAIFYDSLFRDEEVPVEGAPRDAVHADGIMMSVGFHPARLESHRADVRALLGQLPEQFSDKAGMGGWTFLNACLDRDGNEWTGDQITMDKLFMLGMALGQVVSLFERELWSALPGGMPYYMVVSE